MTEPTRPDSPETTNTTLTPGSSSVALAAVVIMAGTVFSRLIGLFREQITAGFYGTGDDIAAFTIAENVLNLVLELVATGMLNGALIPVFAALVIAKSGAMQDLRETAGGLVSLTVVVLVPVILLGMYFAADVVQVMTAFGGKQSRDDETVQLTVELVRIVFPALLFLAIGMILMAVLYALQRPLAPSFSGAMRSATAIGVMVMFHDRLGVRSLAVGALAGSILLMLSQLPALRNAGAMPTLNLHFNSSALRQILRLYFPIFVGLLVSTAIVVLDRNLAWGAETYALGSMRFATMLAQLLMGLVAAAVTLAILPRMSSHFTIGDQSGFNNDLSTALSMVAYLIIPSVMTLAVLSAPIVNLLFAHGNTTVGDADKISLALLGYLPGHLLAAFDQVLVVSFYARQKTVQPVMVGIGASLAFAATALLLVSPFGMMGLVVANSIQFAIHTLVMFWLTRKETGTAGFEGVSGAIYRSMGLGFGMAAAAGMTWLLLDQVLTDGDVGSRLISDFIVVALPLTVAAVMYLIVMRRIGNAGFVALLSQLQAKLSAGNSPLS